MMKKFLLFLIFILSVVLIVESFGHVELSRKRILKEQQREFYLAKGHPLNKKLPVLPKLSQSLRKRQARNTGDLPLEGGETELGEVYVDIKLGNPPVTYTAQLDTGSSDFAIPDTDCPRISCGKPAEVYDPSKSSTSEVVSCSAKNLDCRDCSNGQCEYEIGYADGSGYKARVFDDDMIISNFSSVVQVFGGIYKELSGGGGGAFEPKGVDGICGFAYRKLSEVNAPTPMDTLVASGQAKDVFSMCISLNSGYMTLGGIGAHSGSVQYTPITQELFYTVHVDDMLVGGESLGQPPYVYNLGDAIVDSGTTLFYIPTPAYDSFSSILQNNCSSSNLVGVCHNGKPIKKDGLLDGMCYQMTQKDIQAFPTFSVAMKGIVVDIEPENYIIPGLCGDASYYALGIEDGGSVGGGSIMGIPIMLGKQVVFDRVNARVGFANANCNK